MQETGKRMDPLAAGSKPERTSAAGEPFASVFRDHARYVATQLKRHGVALHDIDDVAQEVFLRLMRIEQHEIIRSPEAYLFTVASHVAHQHTLRESNAPRAVDIAEVFPELQMDASCDPLERAATSQRVKNLKRALDQLPPKLATTLLLHRFDGLSLDEIAAQLGVARITAAKYLAQALLHCRNAADARE